MTLRSYLICFVLQIGSSFAYSQDCEKNDPFYSFKQSTKKYGLKGKVKSTEEYEFKQYVPDSLLISYVTKTILKFDSLLRLEQETIYVENGKLNANYQYVYDSKSNFTKHIFLDSMGNPTMSYTFLFDYINNSYKKLIEPLKRNSNSIKFIEEYIFDKKGNLLIGKSIYPVERVFLFYKYTYNKAGQLTKIEELDPKSKRLLRYEMVIIDPPNQFKLNRHFTADKKFLYDQFKYYDNDCKVIRSVFNNYVIDITYDKNTNNILVEERRKNKIVNTALSYQVEYEYDAVGNWITKTIFRIDNTKLTSVKRKIVYYD